MKLHLFEYANGVKTQPGLRAAYDLANDRAFFGATQIKGHALIWELGGDGSGAKLSAELAIDHSEQWLMRCDRVDFPPGAIAYKHCHPGPGIRFVLFGAITIETQGRICTHGPFDPWFETGPDPVYAPASETESTAFVRVMLLPREWEGKRTIRYLDPADSDKPRLQTARIYFDQPIELPAEG